MENSTMTTSQLIADSYVSYHNQVYLYIQADAPSRYSEIFYLYHFPQSGE